MSGCDSCLGEMLHSALETVEDCEIKLLDCVEDMHAAQQIRSPLTMLRSPVKKVSRGHIS